MFYRHNLRVHALDVPFRSCPDPFTDVPLVFDRWIRDRRGDVSEKGRRVSGVERRRTGVR